VALVAIVLKFSLYLKNFKSFSVLLSSNQQISLFVYSNILQLSFNSSILSDAVLLLAFFSGFVSLALLGEKSITKFLPNSLLFSLFFIATALMVYTTNLLVMFISFEFLFLPTLYFVYFHGYVERTDKTLKILLYWTLSGAFLVLSSLAYLYFKYKTLNYFNLSLLKFSKTESILIFFTIFVGFGVKVPVYPFHYWLTKIHVEAPAGFSIFLSGFLVKAALFCFFQFNVVFGTKSTGLLLYAISFFTLLEASVKM
jgi:NADH-quinone oxidoreductase subunit M